MYKTILVHVDESVRSGQRAAVAARLAQFDDAHVVGAAFTGLLMLVAPVGPFLTGFDGVSLPVEQLRTDAAHALDQFEAAVRGAGLTHIERRSGDEDPAVGISMQARYADLVVISQTAPGEFLPRLRADFPDYVVLNAPRPVLVLPAGGVAGTLGQRVMVAWNGSAEAARAVASAIPLLQRAKHVDIVVFNAQRGDGPDSAAPGADLALYLSRHGVRADVSTQDVPATEGASLLSFAHEKASDLIVMGAYGRSRFREMLLGGTTRQLLTTSTLPLWMAH